MSKEKDFLGIGWSFPPEFLRKDKSTKMVDGKEDINQSLEILLNTSLGERVMQPDYGCNLKDLQFEPINASLIGYLDSLIRDAILYYEPRIKLEKVEITESDSLEAVEGKLRIYIEYIVRTTNSRFNFVYDFYLKEGVS